MKKISVLFLCVLVLLLGGLSSCELIEGAFGSNEKPSATPLENLIGTWKTEGYDESPLCQYSCRLVRWQNEIYNKF